MGRWEEARREIERAQELDPLSLAISMEIGWHDYIARRYDGAIEQSRKTLEMEAGFLAACHTLALGYEQTGQYAKAIAAFERARDGSGGNPVTLACLAHALALAGRKREARSVLAEMKELSKTRYVSPYAVAVVYAGLGEKEQSLDWLENAVEQRDVWLVWIKQEPRFDSLRALTRFEGLLRCLRLPP